MTDEMEFADEADRIRRCNIGRKLAKHFCERAETLKLKGKRRDDAALEYFVGATMLALESGDAKLNSHLGAISALIVAIRGYQGVAEIAYRVDAEKQLAETSADEILEHVQAQLDKHGVAA